MLIGLIKLHTSKKGAKIRRTESEAGSREPGANRLLRKPCAFALSLPLYSHHFHHHFLQQRSIFRIGTPHPHTFQVILVQ